jgi:hypothetical protein
MTSSMDLPGQMANLRPDIRAKFQESLPGGLTAPLGVAHADNAATTYDREAEGEDHHLPRRRGLERSRTEPQ